MSRSENHYLNCTDRDCEFYACLARRDYESKLDNRDVRIKRLDEALKAAISLAVSVKEKGAGIKPDWIDWKNCLLWCQHEARLFIEKYKESV